MTFLVVAALCAFVPMLVELWISQRHEAWLRTDGAIEPPDDVIGVMTVAYPGAFVLMLAESAARSGTAAWPVTGVAVFAAAKTLKWWAMSVLGVRWTFKVLVLPGAPLVTRGPYRWLRHPNYVGVMGELAGVMIGPGPGRPGWPRSPASDGCSRGAFASRSGRSGRAADVVRPAAGRNAPVTTR